MRQRGFTLIDVIIILAVTGILASGMVTFVFQAVNKEREDKTIEHLNRLKVVVTGKPLSMRHGEQTSFGYFGDMGGLPSQLADLYVSGTQPIYTFFPSLKAGAGWNGPYLDPEIVEYITNLDKDCFGRDLQYSTTPFVDATVGETVEGMIISLGKDGKPGTGDDLSVEFFTNELYSSVSGFIKDIDGKGIGSVTVTINYPSNGTLTSFIAITDADGFYSFNRVPSGNHSLSLTPGLILASGSGRTLENGTIVAFSIVNTSTNSVTISAFRAIYNVNPPAFYQRVSIGGASVFNRPNPMVASGETISFPPITLPGAPGTLEAVPIRVRSPVTEVPDIFPNNLGRGQTIEVRIEHFNNTQNGSGGDANMRGIPFEITFSDGSIVTFTP
ncbi:MAG TPA: hypothetical protein ACFYD3_00615 [Candidatus Hypogeohydataceae bacterium YC41]